MQSDKSKNDGDRLNGHWDSHHALLEFEAVDRDTGRISRPWLTMLKDRYSGCIVGFSLRFTPPSGEAVVDALRMGIRRKDEILAHFGGITNAWECHGVPASVTTDTGRAFRSDGLLAASEALQFSIHFKPRRRPWLKGQIESWFKSTERQLFETFPPTVFPAADDRPGTDEKPVLMLDEANWIVAKWIVDIYHQQVDSALACTPAQMWNSGLRESLSPLEVRDDLPQ